jgi:thioredoxin reductase
MMDVLIIGGSFAGLTAALQLARASRSVTIVDASKPRNRLSPAAHGVAGWDGVPPGRILARFREDLAPYPDVQIRTGSVTQVTGVADSFAVAVDGEDRIEARRIILAHGVRDILPDIPGMIEAWGTRVLHCPYCHGYDVKGGSLAVLAVHPMSAHQAQLLRSDWSDHVTLLTNSIDGIDLEALGSAGVRIDQRRLTSVEADNQGLHLGFADGTADRHAALFVGPRTTLGGSPAEKLACAMAQGPMGPFVRVGPMAQTSVPGVFAAGDVARPMPNINFALADGAQAGAGCHASLVVPGFIQPVEEEIAA